MNSTSIKLEINLPNRRWETITAHFSGLGKHSIAVRPPCKTPLPLDLFATIEEAQKPKRRKEHCKYAVIFVAEHFGVPIADMMSKTRENAKAAFARQIAAYIAHTTLSISYTQVAEFFYRDRTTIAHACKTIEDRRDDQCFDAKLCVVENLVGEAVDFVNDCDVGIVQ